MATSVKDAVMNGFPEQYAMRAKIRYCPECVLNARVLGGTGQDCGVDVYPISLSLRNK